MNILGIMFDSELPSAAALISDGNLLAAVQEERLSREKYTDIFPKRSIKFCLEKSGLREEDLDVIIYPYSPWLNVAAKVYLGLKLFPSSVFIYLNNRNNLKRHSLRLKLLLRNFLPEAKKAIFVCVEHHAAHAAGAFFQSPFQEAAILTIDGRGELHSCGLWVGRDSMIKPLKKILIPHSLGFVYSLFTSFLGFVPGKNEGKVMALAAFGRPRFYDEFKKMIKLDSNGGFLLDTSYFDYKNGELGFDKRCSFFSKKMQTVFGLPRKNDEIITAREHDIAASLQRRLEDIVLHLTECLYKKTKIDNLCLSGGLMLNAVMNGRILENSQFKNIFIQPNPSDAGCAIGGVLYWYYNKSPNKVKRKMLLQSDFWGPEYEAGKCLDALSKYNLDYNYYQDIEKETAKLLISNKIVAWFQGRMEFGPRALGNRSILAHPGKTELKKKLWQIKGREEFLPFAATILAEYLPEYFDSVQGAPYMQFVYKIRKKYKDKLPAIVHVDNSVRVQSIIKEDNEKFWKLISEFFCLSGIPMLLNTSFNRRDEPIVCSPQDAINCFINSDIDVLVLGNFLVEKKTGKKDS